ncbi:LysM domain-containing protein [Massilia horti]|uniref:LysM domain-containing protein n=1 Tax=Massilia horti TaxID=2562153 RepID=A0A4Y9T2J0_9BURK|nr:LysM domain-containing protein [Massilia horti]TFW31741.1 LysM domain-containing protein [Massilia horti]
MFPVTSRYYGIETATIEGPDGRPVAYLRRRFVPPPDPGPPLAEHAVVEGDRLDNVTARYLGDPEQFWRVCDANNAMQPQELTDEIGRRLRIVFPRQGAI